MDLCSNHTGWSLLFIKEIQLSDLSLKLFYFTTVLYKQNPNNFKINMNFQLVSMNYSPSELLFILIPNKIIT